MAPMNPSMTEGGGSSGLVVIKSNQQLDAEAAQRREDEERRKMPLLDDLAAYMDVEWEKHKEAKIPYEQLMVKSQRLVDSKYDPVKLAAIEKIGSTHFTGLTAQKCRDAEAWIKDILGPQGTGGWELQPTPKSELPPEVEQVFNDMASKKAIELATQSAMMSGTAIDPIELERNINTALDMLESKIEKQMQDYAERAIKRMSTKIHDQLEEGQFALVFPEVRKDVVRSLAGIVKGPVLRRKTVGKWKESANGGEFVYVKELVNDFSWVSPYDLYPAPGSTGIKGGVCDGNLFERHKFERSDIYDLIGVPGYREDAIRAALGIYGEGHSEWLSIDSERMLVEGRNNSDLMYSKKIDGLEFWGKVPGHILQKFGMSRKKVSDPLRDYYVHVIKIGQFVVRAMLNPDPLGRVPYSVTSFEKVNGCFWGKGVPLVMESAQSAANACARAMLNNVGIASLPLTEVDVDRLASGENSTDIWSGRVFLSTSQAMQESAAIRFYQAPLTAMQIRQVYADLKKEAADVLGIPDFSHGDSQVGGAGNTVGGLSMLMTAASRGIKMLVGNINEDMHTPVVSALYRFNMYYDEDDDIKGDAKIVVRGAEALMAKEQLAVRRGEFLKATANPIDMQIIGPAGRAHMIKKLAESLEYDPDKIVPDAETEEMMAMMMNGGIPGPGGGMNPAEQPEMAAAQAPNANPQKMDNAGLPMGGTVAKTNVGANGRNV